MIGQSQISCNTPTFCIATIFVKLVFITHELIYGVRVLSARGKIIVKQVYSSEDQVPLQMSYGDLKTWEGTRIIVPSMAKKQHAQHPPLFPYTYHCLSSLMTPHIERLHPESHVIPALFPQIPPRKPLFSELRPALIFALVTFHKTHRDPIYDLWVICTIQMATWATSGLPGVSFPRQRWWKPKQTLADIKVTRTSWLLGA